MTCLITTNNFTENWCCINIHIFSYFFVNFDHKLYQLDSMLNQKYINIESYFNIYRSKKNIKNTYYSKSKILVIFHSEYLNYIQNNEIIRTFVVCEQSLFI